MAEKYIKPELTKDLPRGNKQTTSYAEETGLSTKEIIKQFLSLTSGLNIADDEKTEIIKNPVEYFSDSFDGVLSDKHIVIFVKLAAGRFDFPKKDIFELALFLRNYSKMKKNTEGEYSHKEILLAALAIRFVEQHFIAFSQEAVNNSDNEQAQLEMVAYLTNWLTKIKIHAHTQLESTPPSLELRESFIQTVMDLAAKRASNDFGIDFTAIQASRNPALPTPREQCLDAIEKDKNGKDKTIQRLGQIAHRLENLSSETRDIIHLLSEDNKSWSVFLQGIEYNLDQFPNNVVPGDLKLFLEKIKIQIDANQISEENALRAVYNLTESGVDIAQGKKYFAGILEFEKNGYQDKKRVVDQSYHALNAENITDSLVEIKRRLNNKYTFIAADLYLLKALQSILYLFYKAEKLGISKEEIAISLFSGKHGALKIKAKGFETNAASVIYFDGGTALHYYKKQAPFIYLVAQEIYERKLEKSNT